MSEYGLYNNYFDVFKKKQKQTEIINECFQHLDIPANYYYHESLTDRAMSRLTKRLLESFSVERIIEKRRKNYYSYLELLDGLRTVKPFRTELPDGVCPLCFPVFVSDRNRICNKLNEVSISAIPWWAGYHQDLNWEEFPDCCFLKENLLALPLHQKLGRDHIEFIAGTIHRFIE
jgi:perosamine synthetase